jgi:hypothetical protein
VLPCPVVTIPVFPFPVVTIPVFLCCCCWANLHVLCQMLFSCFTKKTAETEHDWYIYRMQAQW